MFTYSDMVLFKLHESAGRESNSCVEQILQLKKNQFFSKLLDV